MADRQSTDGSIYSENASYREHMARSRKIASEMLLDALNGSPPEEKGMYVDVSSINDMFHLIDELDDEIETLYLSIRCGSVSDRNETDICVSSQEFPEKPNIKRLLIIFRDKRLDCDAVYLEELLRKLAAFSGIEILALYLEDDNAPSLRGLPAFSELTDLAVGVLVGDHPLDGLPRFPRLRSISAPAFDFDASECESMRDTLSQMYPYIWLDPDFYVDDEDGIKRCLMNWPRDKELPIIIGNKYYDVILEEYAISKDRVEFWDKDEPYPYKKANVDILFGSIIKTDLKGDPDVVNRVNLKRGNYYPRLIVNKHGVFLKFPVEKYHLNFDAEYDVGYAYLVCDSYWRCFFPNRPRADSDQYKYEEHAFVFCLPESPTADGKP